MKVSVDIDCTPEEARRFLGLPDLGPVHDVYIEQTRRMMAEGVTPDMVQSMVKAWLPMGETGMGIWRQMIEQIGKTARP